VYMKLTSFTLFLLILFVLAISVLVGNWFQSEYTGKGRSLFDSVPGFDYLFGKNMEGLISYYGDVPYGEVKVPNYTNTKPVHKLHDCIYYDPSNGTVILLDGTSHTSGAYDRDGKTISQMTLVDRLSVRTDPLNYNIELSKSDNYQSDISKKPMIDIYGAFIVNFKPSSSSSEDTYEVVYVSWGKETYLHILVLTPFKQILKYTYVYDSDGNRVKTVNKDSTETNVAIHNDTELVNTNPTPADDHSTDGFKQPIPGYHSGKEKFKLCKNNYYDMLNGDIIQKESANNEMSTIKIYSRIVNPNNDVTSTTYSYDKPNSKYTPTLPTPTDHITTVDGFRATFIKGTIDIANGDSYYSILYVSIGDRTLVTLMAKSDNYSNNREYKIHKVYRFQNNQLITLPISGSGTTTVAIPREKEYREKPVQRCSTNVDGNANVKPGEKEMDDLLYKYILKTMVGGYDGATIHDYMLKTQIVPPVCPTCPSCPSSGVCNSCGGTGGSGTAVAGNVAATPANNSNNSNNGNNSNNSNSSDSVTGLLRDAGSGTVGLAKDAGSGTVGLAKDAGSGTAGLARDAASGTVGLAKDAVGGTVGLAKDAVGGTVGLAKDAVGGTVGLAKDAVGGVANTFGKLAPTEITNINDGSYAAGGGRGSSITTGSDRSSYFGALPPKGSEFIPITADFSKFGR